MKSIQRFFQFIYMSYLLGPYFSSNAQKITIHPNRGKKIRKTLEALGPIFIKFGQLLSTRADMLPADIILELSKLQDRAEPFSGKTAQRLIETALQCPLSEVFQDFEMIPLAAASVAQVHAATLLTGESVVIKVLRPNIHKTIQRDIRLLKRIAQFSHRFWKASRTFKVLTLVEEFETILNHECDLMREAANASQLKRNSKDSMILYIPKIYWTFTRHQILVMEKIHGISILDLQSLKAQDFDLKRIAEILIEVFFTEAFRDCFFHADMHPGNIFVTRNEFGEPALITVDFGIVGTLTPKDQHYLANNFIAFLNRDYRRVAALHLESGWIPNHTRLDAFEAAIRTVSEPILEQNLNKISFGQLLLKLFQMASHYEINIQPQLLLLQKTLLNIEGLSRTLDPDINLLEIAKPFLEKWLKNEMGVLSFLKKLTENKTSLLEKLPEFRKFISMAFGEQTS